MRSLSCDRILFSPELRSKLCSLREREREKDHEGGQAGLCPPTYVLCYLSWSAADSHMSKPGERPLYMQTGRAGRSKACIVSRNNVPSSTYASPFSSLDLHEHTDTQRHAQTSPLLTAAYTDKCTQIVAQTHRRTPLPMREPLSSDLL